MDIYPESRRATTGFGAGARTALIVVVLGSLAAFADHAYFLAPHDPVQPVAAATAPVAAPAPDGVAFTADLHPTAADVAPQPPTF
jgi:hypothetical protein